MGPVRALGLVLAAVALAGCAHAPPLVVTVFDQVNRVYNPVTHRWTDQLSVFLLASSGDGAKVFDRLHLIQDERQLVFSLNSHQWTTVERPGEFWVGAQGLSLPDGTVPTGRWRAVLVTKDGQRVEATFAVPPQPRGAPRPRTDPVTLGPVPGAPAQVRVSGWVDDTLVWFCNAQGRVVNRAKIVGSQFGLPPGTASVILYSYDNNRGEGLEAGPFPVQHPENSADR